MADLISCLLNGILEFVWLETVPKGTTFHEDNEDFGVMLEHDTETFIGFCPLKIKRQEKRVQSYSATTPSTKITKHSASILIRMKNTEGVE
jgi:hypothetical protein